MVIKADFFKSSLCLFLCISLVFFSVNGGEFIAENAQGVIDKCISVSKTTTTATVNRNSVAKTESYSIIGFGGGGYESETVSITPTDIETLKKQAEKLYKTYKKSGTIKEKQMGATSITQKYGNILLDNKTNQDISIKTYLNKTPTYKTVTKEKPYILIYHTHSTEGYEMLDLGWYSNSYNSRTKDKSKNMVRVGDALTKVLEDSGFNVIHDRKIYDTTYTGAYGRSRVSVEKYLEKYPSIMVTLDVHRDAIHYDGGVKCKPTAKINGKKAAQVMIITGCEGGGVESFPTWKENLTFTLDLQNQVEKKYKGLMRPVYFSHRKYNMDLTPCSVLLEFGTDANTLEEAVYSAELIGKSLGEMLNEQMK